MPGTLAWSSTDTRFALLRKLLDEIDSATNNATNGQDPVVADQEPPRPGAQQGVRGRRHLDLSVHQIRFSF